MTFNMTESKLQQHQLMKLSLALIAFIFGISVSAKAENINYYCDGDTTRTMGDGPHVEETDTKTYAFIGNETEFYAEKIKCDVNQKSIHCYSKKFNRTLDINKASGYATDVYEILKNGKPHVKIEFIGICETY